MMNLFHNQSISNEYKSLCKVASVVYSEFTTNTDANRKRYLSGIFLPQVYHFKQWHGFTTGVIHSLKLVTSRHHEIRRATVRISGALQY